MKIISRMEAYTAIRKWYQSNIGNILEENDNYNLASVKLIRAMPSPDLISDVEIQAIFMHVKAMYLEWGYNETDGIMTMSQYVDTSLNGDTYLLSNDQKKELRHSRLWPYLGLS